MEARRLLAATLPVSVNFQPASSAVPSGYVADTGATFGDRGNGYSYGWNTSLSSAARDRNDPSSPDQRYDTLIHTQLSGSATWEIALPNGSYTVHLVAGDPSYIDSVYKFDVEGVPALSGTPTSSNHWISTTVTVNVSDGRLTVSNASGSSNNKLDFIDISAASGTTTQSPFGAVPHIPGTIEAENFDNGGQGVSYYDTTSGNIGGIYRNTDVDVKATSDAGGGYLVGWTRPGEWLEYTVTVDSSATYTLESRIASANGGSFHLEFDGANKTGSITLPNTGGWQNWATISTSGISLSAGTHIMRLVFDSSYNGGDIGNINWLRLSTTTPTSTSAWPSSFATGPNAPSGRW